MLYDLPNPSFKEKFDEEQYIGKMTVEGFVFPRGKDAFDPLGKIWSSCKKRFREDYGVDVTATFLYGEEKVDCQFHSSSVYAEERGIDNKIYLERFKDNFSQMMGRFVDAIKAFLEDEDDGYGFYLELIKVDKNINQNVYDQIFNRFLKKKGLKTKKDEEKKQKQRAKKQAQK